MSQPHEQHEAAASHALDLCGEWCFAFADPPPAVPITSLAALEGSGLALYPARVPGNLELDLMAAGLVQDPFVGLNCEQMRPFERAHLWYGRRFSLGPLPEGAPELVLEGVDCLAEVYLNGGLLGRTDDMLVEHVLPAEGLRAGENEVLVHISPAVLEAQRHAYPPSLAAMPGNLESLYVRKAPHQYGWDILPRLLSGGLWRPVSLRFRPPERLRNTYLQTVRLAEDGAWADFLFHYEADVQLGVGDCELVLEGACGGSTFREARPVTFSAGHFAFRLERPRLWWPRGSGEPELYQVNATLLRDGAVLDRRSFRHGVRTVELRRTSTTTSAGEGEFCFVVNHERLFVKGSNWVPADALHSRDRSRVPALVALAEDLDCNLLRCWGGNVYECDLFFDLCDEKGILVWQDFAMACATYPQDEAFQSRLAEEARKVVRRLRQHPSLALWAGDNENDMAYAQGWFGMAPRDPNLNALTRKVLPEVLRDEDPGRPYLPSSPYIDAEAYRTGLRFLPEDHLWGPRDYFKGPYYQGALCHFASEIGYHGCPAPGSLRRFLSRDKVWPHDFNQEWGLHSTSPTRPYGDGRVRLVENQVRELFGQVPESLEEFVFASQASQAEAMKSFVEAFRSAKWRRTGIVWWNLADGWPQISDAVVDYYLVRKLAYHWIRASQQRLCLMLREPSDWCQELVAVNDLRRGVAFNYRVSDVGSREVLLEGSSEAPANGLAVLGRVPFSHGQQRLILLTWDSDLGPGRNHYLAGHPPFDLFRYRDWLVQAGLPSTVEDPAPA